MAASRTAEEISDAVGYVCANWASLKDVLSARERRLLQRLRKALREQKPISELLEGLHHAIVNGGDVHGVYGHATRGTSGTDSGGNRALTGLGLGSARRAEVVFLCPIGCCTRFAVAETTVSEPPYCDIGASAMRWERL